MGCRHRFVAQAASDCGGYPDVAQCWLPNGQGPSGPPSASPYGWTGDPEANPNPSFSYYGEGEQTGSCGVQLVDLHLTQMAPQMCHSLRVQPSLRSPGTRAGGRIHRMGMRWMGSHGRPPLWVCPTMDPRGTAEGHYFQTGVYRYHGSVGGRTMAASIWRENQGAQSPVRDGLFPSHLCYRISLFQIC